MTHTHLETSVSTPLEEELQRTLSFAVVTAQDRGLSVRASREAGAAGWRVSLDGVKAVEWAGLNGR